MIDSFTGEYRFLSNFYPCEITIDGVTCPSLEHAYQVTKTNDPTEKFTIASATTPGKAKRMGQKVHLRSDWEQVKVQIMTVLVRQKFGQNRDLRQKLLDTGDEELVEGNRWGDRYWGISGGSGQNWLGRILMQVRGELRPV